MQAKPKREKISQTIDQVASLLQKKMEKEDTAEGSDEELKKICGYSKKMMDLLVLDIMSPQSRDKYVDTLKRKWKDVIEKMTNPRHLENKTEGCPREDNQP